MIVAPARPNDKVNGILIPESAQRNQVYGRIIEKGPEVPDDYQVGDLIIFSQYAGLELEMEDVEGTDDRLTVLFMPYKQILGKLTMNYADGSPAPVTAPEIPEV